MLQNRVRTSRHCSISVWAAAEDGTGWLVHFPVCLQRNYDTKIAHCRLKLQCSLSLLCALQGKFGSSLLDSSCSKVTQAQHRYNNLLACRRTVIDLLAFSTMGCCLAPCRHKISIRNPLHGKFCCLHAVNLCIGLTTAITSIHVGLGAEGNYWQS